MFQTKILSFDMDGTVTDLSFVDSVWLEGIPRLYSHKYQLPMEEAKRRVKMEYDKVGRERLEWYDLNHWNNEFGLDFSPEGLLGSFQHKIRVFPEVPAVISAFKRKGLRLIVTSNARREFLNLELDIAGIASCFERVFSSTSDFGLTKKTVDLYQKVCNTCDIYPEEMVHVGDDLSFDFEVPRALGIKAYFLDRSGVTSGEFVIHDLKELEEKCLFDK